MNRSLIDRLDDTAVFKVLLFLSGAVTVPLVLLGLGTLTPALLGSISQSSRWEELSAGLLPVGGAIGLVGWLRAHWGVRSPAEHNITLTLICIAFGIATALFVGGYVTLWTIDKLEVAPELWALLPAAFAAAQLVWVLSGIAWAERLVRAYAGETNEAFDAIPALLLAVVTTLTCAATFITITL